MFSRYSSMLDPGSSWGVLPDIEKSAWANPVRRKISPIEIAAVCFAPGRRGVRVSDRIWLEYVIEGCLIGCKRPIAESPKISRSLLVARR